jgi:IS1 family transposase
VKLLAEAGEACAEYQSDQMVDLPCSLLQMDEIWSFVGCKEKAKEKAKGEHPGDVWTWTALCADTKIIPSWRVGDRSGHTAFEFCADLSERFAGSLQISTDGHPAYRWAIGANFDTVDYAKLVKIYGTDENGMEIVTGIRKEPVFGTPDIDHVSTSYVERANLTIRMTNRRFTRLTNGFSKKLENHCHMLAVQFMNYNFCRKHTTIKTTPAKEAGVTDREWKLEEVVEMMDEYFVEKQNREFEEEFAKLTRPRKEPRTYEIKEPKTPWYLDPESGGKNPAVKKEGIAYGSELP